MQNDVFTTFEAARYCQVHFETIKNWIRRGRLKAYRTPGGHYRIKREHLEKLMRDNNFPVEGNKRLSTKVLVYSDKPANTQSIANRLHACKGNYEVSTTDNIFLFGMLSSREGVEILVVSNTDYHKIFQFAASKINDMRIIHFPDNAPETVVDLVNS